MLRLFVIFHLLFLTLFACKGGYDSCIKKINDSQTIQKNSLYIPVKNNQRLIYSKTPSKSKILKQDPFLSLYLVEDKSNFAYDFDFNIGQDFTLASVNDKNSIKGKIVKNQVGLNSLARYSKKYQAPALLLNNCCSLEGIVTPNGIIQKEYIQRFLSSAPAEYSDIGIRVKNDNGFVVITASNPYMKNNPFKRGDLILAFDGKRVKAASVFMRELLFSKIGSKHKIKIKRGSKFFTFHVTTQKRVGGGEISDTFLEFKGIYFNKKLQIVKLSPYFKEYGLLLGDRLIQVNTTSVQTQEELLRYIENFQNFSSLLFERDKFQFFVNIK